MNNTAVFAGSFDPFTLGHYDIARRACKQFDKVVIAVAAKGKNFAFDLEKRLTLARLSVIDLKNAEVTAFDGFLTDFMRRRGIRYFVRGLRNCADFEYERELYAGYKSMYPDVEGCYYLAAADLSHVSSSFVREIIALGGDVSGYMRKEAAEEIG